MVSATKNAASVWSVGDTKDLLVGSETLAVEIIGFNHDDLTDGSGKAGITFATKNLMANKHDIGGPSSDNSCYIYSGAYFWLTGTVFNSIEESAKSVMKAVDKRTNLGRGNGSVNITSMSIFLLSTVEIDKSSEWWGGANNEGTQYAKFSSASNRIKKLANGTGNASEWWTRSCSRSGVGAYDCVTSAGYIKDGDNRTSNKGICFGFDEACQAARSAGFTCTNLLTRNGFARIGLGCFEEPKYRQHRLLLRSDP